MFFLLFFEILVVNLFVICAFHTYADQDNLLALIIKTH